MWFLYGSPGLALLNHFGDLDGDEDGDQPGIPAVSLFAWSDAPHLNRRESA